jgi:aspartate aminotransferase-like enzyme
MTPTTPSIAHCYALRSKLDDIRAEGIEERYARHARLNKTVRAWGYANGFRLLPEERFGSLTLNCFENTRGVDLVAFNLILKTKHQLVIDGGYGKLKGRTFRISNMGDETDASIAVLLAALDSALAEAHKRVA